MGEYSLKLIPEEKAELIFGRIETVDVGKDAKRFRVYGSGGDKLTSYEKVVVATSVRKILSGSHKLSDTTLEIKVTFD